MPEIDEFQASIVRRIFTEYASGKSPMSIAADLDRDEIASPKGKVWNYQSFVGGRHARGMITNAFYIGELRWFSHRTELSPYTGKNVKRRSAEDEVVIQVPQYRIIDQKLWDAAQAIRKGRAVAKFGPSGKVSRRQFIPQHKSILAGILKCGCCGAHMRIAQQSRNGGPRMACSAAHQHLTCSHRRSYDLGRLEAAVLDGLRTQLADPGYLAEFLSEFAEQKRAQSRQASSEVSQTKKRLADIEASIMRYVNALERGSMPEDIIVDRLQKLEVERVGLQERLRLIGSEAKVVEIHPVVIERYKREIEILHVALRDNTMRAESREAFRNLVDSVIVRETRKRMPYEVEIYGRPEALLGIDLFPERRKPAQIVAEHGSNTVISGSDGLASEKSVSS